MLLFTVLGSTSFFSVILSVSTAMMLGVVSKKGPKWLKKLSSMQKNPVQPFLSKAWPTVGLDDDKAKIMKQCKAACNYNSVGENRIHGADVVYIVMSLF